MSSPDDNEADDLQAENYQLFRDCLHAVLLRPPHQEEDKAPRRHRRANKTGYYTPVASQQARDARNAQELAEFAEYLSSEIFSSLPEELQNLTYRTWRESEFLQSSFSLPIAEDALSSTITLPVTIIETLTTYNIISTDPDAISPLPSSPEAFMIPILTDYITELTKSPVSASVARSTVTECELCDRDWVPLTYHHLIPRFIHDKVVKRGWHRKEDLQNAAWLCRACHSYIHHVKTHEELARYYYTVDMLLEDEAIAKFAAWISKVRWKGNAIA